MTVEQVLQARLPGRPSPTIERTPGDPTIKRVAPLARELDKVFERRWVPRGVRGAKTVERTIRKEWRELIRLSAFPTRPDADRLRVIGRLTTMTQRVRQQTFDSLNDAVNRAYDETYQVLVNWLPAAAWQALLPVVEQVNFRGSAEAGALYFPPTVEQALTAINSTNVRDGLTWGQRLSRALPPVQVDRIANIMAAAMAEGLGPRDIARRIRPFVQGYANRAVTIARTEVLRSSQVIQRQAFQSIEPVIAAWQVISARDDRVRPEHVERDGRIYVKPGFEKFFPDAAPLSERPDTPDAPNCRCVVVPVLRPQSDLLDFAQQRLVGTDQELDRSPPPGIDLLSLGQRRVAQRRAKRE